MKYVWTQNLETGNESIDLQHKALIEALNRLVDATMRGCGCQELKQTVEFLEGYTKKHFADEEALQLTYQYPDYESHKKLHEEFCETVREIGEKLLEEGATMKLLGRVNREMGDWLILHIKIEDVRLARYIREHSADREDG